MEPVDIATGNSGWPLFPFLWAKITGKFKHIDVSRVSYDLSRVDKKKLKIRSLNIFCSQVYDSLFIDGSDRKIYLLGHKLGLLSPRIIGPGGFIRVNTEKVKCNGEVLREMSSYFSCPVVLAVYSGGFNCETSVIGFPSAIRRFLVPPESYTNNNKSSIWKFGFPYDQD